MSATRGDIVNSTLKALRRALNDETRATVEGYVNNFYADICRMMPIKALRRQTEIDLSSSDYSSGMWLPSNLAGILNVTDVDDGFQYIERDRASIEQEDSSYRYYSYVPSSGPGYYGDDCNLLQGGTTFTSTDLIVDYTGDYIKFGNEPGLYLLSAIKTFSPAYYGPNLRENEFIIRPSLTEKIVAIDESEDEITDRSLYVDYWETPLPLYKDIDVPVLPSTRALELMVMKEALSVIGKRQLSSSSYDKDISAALDELRKLCPSVASAVRAKDVVNKVFTFSNNIFTERA